MDDNTTMLISLFIFFGWIPIFAIGYVIKDIIKCYTYYKYVKGTSRDDRS